MGHEVTQRHYCLRFGTRGSGGERIEVRDIFFERIGHCAAHDLQSLAALLGRPLDQHLQDRIAAIPHGQITAIEL